MRLTRDLLIDSFTQYTNPGEQMLVGAEFERHVLLPNGRPLPYLGHGGIGWLLDQYSKKHEWTPTTEGPNTIALTKGKARVTLEPGAQLELSGSPFSNLQDIQSEASLFDHNVRQLLQVSGAKQIAVGFTPFASIPSIDWVPKGRYSIMRAHLLKTGDLAHHMMKGTCAVQASYDFRSETDCAEKVQLSTKLGPLTTAIFANSPFSEGKNTDWVSYRGHIWTRTDPKRTGFPEAANAFTFAAWVDYLLDAPMMFYHFGNDYVPAHGRSFRSWLENGQDGRFPVFEDWEIHLTSVFPEVRVKHAIEVRGADCVAMPLAMSFVALFKGLFYHQESRHKALALADKFTATGDQFERFNVACKDGLKGQIQDQSYLDLAEQLFDLAKVGLQATSPEDVGFLTPLEQQLERGESPGHTLRANLEGGLTPEHLFELTAL